MKKTATILSILLALLMVLNVTAFAGNGGGNGDGGGENPLSVVAVKVDDKDLEGQAIKPEGEITIVFDRGMTDNQAANFEQISFVDGEGKKVEGLTMSFTDFTKDKEGNSYTVLTYSGLKNGEYSLKLGADLKANNGKTLGKDVLIAFTVEGAPEEPTEEPEPTGFQAFINAVVNFFMNSINAIKNFFAGLFA